MVRAAVLIRPIRPESTTPHFSAAHIAARRPEHELLTMTANVIDRIRKHILLGSSPPQKERSQEDGKTGRRNRACFSDLPVFPPSCEFSVCAFSGRGLGTTNHQTR